YLESHPDASNREIAKNIDADISHPTVQSRRQEIEKDDSNQSIQQTLDTVQSPTPTSDENLSEPRECNTSLPRSNPSSIDHPQSDEKATPRSFFDPIADAIGGFDVDAAAGAEKEPLATESYTIEDDGLNQEWHGDIWVNPPFSTMDPWVDKILSELATERVDTVVLLCKSDNSTNWWQKAAGAAEIVTAIDHRLSFGDDESVAPFATHLLIFGVITPDLTEALSEKGLLLTPVDNPESLFE
ncbi:MAG: DNA N-6-adenine-methyltransferase, partial [Halanaeroarchaeum sp.]